MASKPNYINEGDDIMSNHEYFMKEAINLSALAMEHGNEPFGAVLVKDGEIVCTYENQIHTMTNPTLHGETGLISKFCQETGSRTCLNIPFIPAANPVSCAAEPWFGRSSENFTTLPAIWI